MKVVIGISEVCRSTIDDTLLVSFYISPSRCVDAKAAYHPLSPDTLDIAQDINC